MKNNLKTCTPTSSPCTSAANADVWAIESASQSSEAFAKTDPNTNVFLHQFDTEGRTIQTSDSTGGLWNFFSSRQGNSSALYGYTTAELNTYQTLQSCSVTTVFE